MAVRRTGEPAEGYRTGYLKLRSVLHDRASGLPAYPVHIDRLRSALDGRRQLGVLHFELLQMDLVESLYGWQVFDRVVARAARVLETAVGRELPRSTLLSVDGVAGACLVAFLIEQADDQEVTADYLADVAARIGAKLQRALRQRELAGLSPPPDCRVGHALLSLNP